MARIYGWIAQAHSMRGDPDRQVSHYVANIQAMDLTLEPEIAARVGQLFLHRGLFNQAISVLKPAIAPLVGANLLLEWVHANGALAIAEAGSGDYKTGVERAEGGVQRASKFPGDALNAPARNYLANTLIMGGEWQRAAEINEQNAEHVKSMNHPAATAIRDTLTCAAQARRADYELDHVREMQAVLEDVQNSDGQSNHTRAHEQPLLEAWHEAFHAQMAFQCGNMQAAIRHADAAVQAAANRGDVFGEGIARRIKGQALADDDPNNEEIDTLMRASRDALTKGGCELELARTLSAWGYIQLQRGNMDGKDRLLSALRTFESAGLTWEAARIRPLI
jgi:tetratricopeptide (TPR) repeat protein